MTHLISVTDIIFNNFFVYYVACLKKDNAHLNFYITERRNTSVQNILNVFKQWDIFLEKLIKLKLTDLLSRIWRDDVIIFNVGEAPIGKVVIAVTSEISSEKWILFLKCLRTISILYCKKLFLINSVIIKFKMSMTIRTKHFYWRKNIM